MPLVSVIMPSYNHERFIGEAIESVLNQTIDDLELIIVDDASIDGSRQIIEEFKEKDNRIRTIYHDKNSGIALTKNEGIENANGKFIAILDSDDIWTEDKLKQQLEILKNDEDLIVWSEGAIINIEGKPTGEKFSEKYIILQKRGNIFKKLLMANFIFNSSMIFKKKNVKSIKFNNDFKYLSDYQFNVDLAHNYEFYFIPKPLVKYRLHGKNSVFEDRRDWYKDSVMINNYFLQEYGYELSNKFKISMWNMRYKMIISDSIKPKFWNKNLIYVIIPLIQLNTLLIKDFLL